MTYIYIIRVDHYDTSRMGTCQIAHASGLRQLAASSVLCVFHMNISKISHQTGRNIISIVANLHSIGIEYLGSNTFYFCISVSVRELVFPILKKRFIRKCQTGSCCWKSIDVLRKGA